MPQSTLSEPVMTGRNPNGHYQPVHASSTWDWTVKPSCSRRQLSREARTRKAWLEWCDSHGGNVSLTCRHFGISRRTFYRWQGRAREHGDAGLESRSSRPVRARKRTWGSCHVEAVLKAREKHPGRGKMKIQVGLRKEGIVISASMIGRILKHARTTRKLKEPARVANRRRRPWKPRPWARRSTVEERIALWPGDLIQVDTKDVRPVPGKVFKQLTAVDVVSRCAAAEVGVGAKASTMTGHLDRMLSRLPFCPCAIQIDGGSEFKADFEAYCQKREIPLYVLPPYSPKLNGRVERLQRTFQEEFYDCYCDNFRLELLRPALARFEDDYNRCRPHQALGYLTPTEYLDSRKVVA